MAPFLTESVTDVNILDERTSSKISYRTLPHGKALTLSLKYVIPGNHTS